MVSLHESLHGTGIPGAKDSYSTLSAQVARVPRQDSNLRTRLRRAVLYP